MGVPNYSQRKRVPKLRNQWVAALQPGVALPARPRRVKANSGELKLYVILPGWRVELLLSFQFSIRY